MACSSIDSLPPISASTGVAMLGNRGVSRVVFYAVLTHVQTQYRPTYGTVKRNSYIDDGARAGKKLQFCLDIQAISCPFLARKRKEEDP